MNTCWKCTHPQAIQDVDEFVLTFFTEALLWINSDIMSSKSVPMKKQTHLHFACPEGEKILSKLKFLGGLFFNF